MSSLELENFFPVYSFVENPQNINIIDEKDPIIDEKIVNKFYSETYFKKEFNDTKLDVMEQAPKKGELLKHQQFVAKFFSPITPYDRGLIFHEIGTGKTCAAIALTLEAKKLNPGINRALILVRNEVVIKNFIDQLVHKCGNDQYLPANFNDLTPKQKVTRINTLIGVDYQLETFETFAKYLASIGNDDIISEFSNRIIIIDEAHNIRYYTKVQIEKTKEKLDIHTQIHRMLHLSQNTRVLLLTATPMRDKPSELADILNLILPKNKQLPYGSTFNSKFITSENKINTNALKPYLVGVVSYVRSSNDVKVINEGKIPQNFKKFKIFETQMIGLQEKIYKKAYELDTKVKPSQQEIKESEENIEKNDKKSSGLYHHSIQASLFVYPTDNTYQDGVYGPDGYNKYVIISRRKQEVTSDVILPSDVGKKENITRRFLDDSLIKILKKGTSSKKIREENITIILNNIGQCSSKYKYVIEQILAYPKRCTFVYSNSVHGSGAIIFSLLLTLFGFKESEGDETKTGRRFAVLTGETSTGTRADKIRTYFNMKENNHGDYLQVIVGSRIIGEGTNFRHMQQIFNLTPHWNDTEISQALGRGIRAFAHTDLLPEEKIVHVYRMASTLSIGDTIDLYMYKYSEDKDLIIQQILRLLKEYSVDCSLNVLRNIDKKELENEEGYQFYECAFDIKEFGVDRLNTMNTYQLSQLHLKLMPNLDPNLESEQKLKKIEDEIDILTKEKKQLKKEKKDEEDEINKKLKLLYNTLDDTYKEQIILYYRQHPTSQLITDTYNLHYAEKDIQDIKIQLESLFKKQISYTFDELFILLANYSSMIVIRALSNLIDTNTIIYNRYGMECYLREKDNMYFLLDEINLPSNEFLTYYTSNPIQKTIPNFKNIIIKKQLANIKEKIQYINELKTEEQQNEFLYSKIIPEVRDIILRELIIEYYIPNKPLPKNLTTIWKLLKVNNMQEYQNYIQVGTKCIKKEIGRIWLDCDESMKVKFKEKKKQAHIQTSPILYGYQKIEDFDKSGTKVFKIRDTTSKRSTGRSCSTTKKENLIKIIENLLKHEPNNPILSKVTSRSTIEDICNVLRKWFNSKESSIVLD